MSSLPSPPALEPATYLHHLVRESRRFREVLASCDPTARVPSCPDWDAADLLWHLAGVQWHWAWVVRMRPAAPPEDLERPERPTTYTELLECFDDCSAALVTELGRADPADTAWTWAPEQTVGFTFRRQAHEAAIHRVDAELAAGLPVTALDPALAADGVLEVLDVVYGGHPDWGRFVGGPHVVQIAMTDVGASVWVQLGRFSGTEPDGTEVDEPDIGVVPDPGVPADAVVSGTAAGLDTWLWKRIGPLTDTADPGDTGITVTGSAEVGDRLLEVLGQPVE